jgi:putative transposase
VPNRFEIRKYAPDTIYHVYNRGVEKRIIFQDDQDYAIFLHLLKYFLSPGQKDIVHPLVGLQGYKNARPRPMTTLYGQVELHSFCLMPNHFHLLLRQVINGGVTALLRRVCVTYAVYFNHRYERVGHLFQGKFKAILVDDDSYIIHLSRYININPLELGLTRSDLVSYPYSSYAYYLGEKHAIWLKTDFILNYFKNDAITYKKFVEGESNSESALGYLTLE